MRSMLSSRAFLGDGRAHMRHDGMAHVAVLVGAMWCTLAWVLVPYVVLTALTGYTRPYVAVER
jgi:hypothetical protein